MSEKNKLWSGVSEEAQNVIQARAYKTGPWAERLATSGVEAVELTKCDRKSDEVKKAWIPGVEIFARTIHPQRHRGIFGEFVRRDEGILSRIGLWPAQWAAARMFAGTAKGFHLHPPFLPPGQEAAKWFQKLFEEAPENHSQRPYDREQWDVMFFVQGIGEMILRDVRAGMPSRTMRFFVEGDNHRGQQNIGIVIPAGVAHAIRVEGSEDLIMVYGTSVSFQPEFEGRIGSEVETAQLPESWMRFLES